VPLHADEIAVARCLERLHEAVVGACGDDETVADAVDALVVVAVHVERARADLLREAAPRVDLDGVLGEDAAADPVALGAERFGQVLVQRAAVGDVRELQPAADREHGDAALLRTAQERQLPRVAVGAGRIGERMPVRAVQFGLHVEPAREDQSVERVEHRRGRVIGAVLRREQHGDAARGRHRGEVLLRQECGAHVPHPCFACSR
jgi:hypothetical protein